MKSPRKPKGERPDFAVQVASFAIEEALRLSPKNASQRFVALIVPPRPEDAPVYEEAALRYLRNFLNSLPGDPQPAHAQIEEKSLGIRLRTFWGLSHIILIVPDEEKITPEDRLAADRAVSLREPSAEDFCKAVRTIYDALMPGEAANFLVGKPLATLALAFPKGRSFSSAMRKARVYFRAVGHAQRNDAAAPVSKTPRGSRTLHHLPGYGEAKTWGVRLANDIVDWKSGRIEWNDVDKGVVLMGPPGVGKTVFARALANTCDVELIQTSAARWVAKGHLGDTLKAMRQEFAGAKARAPAILFVDELDSFPTRDRDRGDKSEYYQQLVNGFLECLDGIDGRDGVVVVGATNRIQDVDPALLRPGRLERVIEIPLPDVEVRNEILRLNLPDLPQGRSERFDLATSGWSGAEIEQLARDVARECRTSGREVSMTMVEAALPELRALEEEVHRRIAIHEAGHAVYARIFERRKVKSMAVSPFAATRENVSSGIVIIEEEQATARTEKWYRGQIAICLAGISAERIVFGSHADGGGGSEMADLARATHLATCMVAVYGMDGMWSAEPTTDPKTLGTLRRLDPRLRNQVDKIVENEFQLVSDRLATKEDLVRRLAEAVRRKAALESDEIDAIVLGPWPTDTEAMGGGR